MTFYEAISEQASDEAVLAAVAIGDTDAAAVLVRRYQKRVFGLALTMVGDRGMAEEIAQEALLRAWRHAALFDSKKGSVSSWVLTITRNLAIDRLRVRTPVSLDPEVFFDMALSVDERSPADAAVSNESDRQLRRAIAALPVEQRRALVLVAFFGLTAAQVAEQELIPLGTVKSRVRSAMMRLRSQLGGEVGRGRA